MEGGGTVLLQNISNSVPVDTAWHPRRHELSSVPLWELKILKFSDLFYTLSSWSFMHSIHSFIHSFFHQGGIIILFLFNECAYYSILNFTSLQHFYFLMSDIQVWILFLLILFLIFQRLQVHFWSANIFLSIIRVITLSLKHFFIIAENVSGFDTCWLFISTMFQITWQKKRVWNIIAGK